MQGRDPLFSIVIPTRNRPAALARCLAAVGRLDFARDAFEVVVVDDGGRFDLSDACSSAPGCRVRVLRQSHAGPAAARNLGAFQARGRYLAFTDDDCAPHPGWLRGFGETFARDGKVLAGGRTVNALRRNLYSGASQLLVDYLYDYFGDDTRGARFFASNNVAVPAAVFRQMGGFDESFPLAAAEDREFCERWQRFGHPMVYAEDAIVLHAHVLGPTKFVRQHFNYGRGADHLHVARARLDSSPVQFRAEPLHFYRNLIAYPLRVSQGWRKVPLAALMAVSQAAYAAGYAWERSQRTRGVRVPARRPSRARQTLVGGEARTR